MLINKHFYSSIRRKRPDLSEYNKKRKGIYKCSNKTKEKMRLAHLGKKHSNENKKKISNALKGKTKTEEHKKKIQETIKKVIWLPKNREKYLKSYTKEIRIKQRINVIKSLSSDTVREKMRLNVLGEKNPMWVNGRGRDEEILGYSSRWTEFLKRKIRERDKYICQQCDEYGWVVHHIDYNKENCDLYNLITLCHICHAKTNINRKHWQSYLTNLQEFRGVKFISETEQQIIVSEDETKSFFNRINLILDNQTCLNFNETKKEDMKR